MNYFELYELPVSFEVDKKDLSQKYFALQKKYHPDFYGNADEAEQAEVLEKSALINKAYKTFNDPDLTIKYVLGIKGLLEDEEKFQLPPDFLMEMMDLNESIDEESDVKARETIINKNIDQLYKEVESIIKNYNDQDSNNSDLLKVKQYYFKKKYLVRILDRLAGMSNIAP